MGVGLSISRTIVESHGGKIAVSESPNGGATSTFTIAVAQQNGHLNGR
jgi:signal transduction histidine kinase